MKKILLAGNAIAANILYGYLAKDSRYQVMGLTVEDDFVGTGGIEGIETIPISRICDLYKPQDHEVIMAIGYHSLNRVRETLFNRLKSFGYKMESYVHKDAKVYTHHPLGEGCVILPNAVIEPHARVGANSMILDSGHSGSSFQCCRKLLVGFRGGHCGSCANQIEYFYRSKCHSCR